jgi:hypothetical protein
LAAPAVAPWAEGGQAPPTTWEKLAVTTRQAILVAILLLAIATAFAAIAVEVFGGSE